MFIPKSEFAFHIFLWIIYSYDKKIRGALGFVNCFWSRGMGALSSKIHELLIHGLLITVMIPCCSRLNGECCATLGFYDDTFLLKLRSGWPDRHSSLIHWLMVTNLGHITLAVFVSFLTDWRIDEVTRPISKVIQWECIRKWLSVWRTITPKESTECFFMPLATCSPFTGSFPLLLFFFWHSWKKNHELWPLYSK